MNYKIFYNQVIEELNYKIFRMNRYINYMTCFDYLEMLNYSYKNKIKYFYK